MQPAPSAERVVTRQMAAWDGFGTTTGRAAAHLVSLPAVPPQSPSPDGRRARTRAAILHAASGLLAEQGPDGTSIAAIAKRADVSVGSIYVHFGNRDALILALVGESVAPRVAELRAARRGRSPFERVLAFGDLFIEFAIADPGSARSLAQRSFSPSEPPAHTNDEAVRLGLGMVAAADYLSGDLEEAMSTGEIDRSPVQPAITMLLAMWTGIAEMVLRQDGHAITPEVARQAWEIGRTVLSTGLHATAGTRANTPS